MKFHKMLKRLHEYGGVGYRDCKGAADEFSVDGDDILCRAGPEHNWFKVRLSYCDVVSSGWKIRGGSNPSD